MEYNGNINELLRSIYDKYNYRYIECQLWEKEYIENIININKKWFG